ncbi:speedy protein A-like [Lycorma delicatula]|uniref:speedy protein A-like n=1 Tax=Lycorma delicatula TaxID=130591 RepID=UPI003F50F279
MLRFLNPMHWFLTKKDIQNRDENGNTNGQIIFTNNDLRVFVTLVNSDSVIRDFLHFDSCSVLADKYLLAICFAYFIRAELDHNQYNRVNFFAALYLAHSMEEDDDSLRLLIIPWSDGSTIAHKKQTLIDNHIKLWHAMKFRTLVSKAACEEVIRCIPEASIWKRFRPECHGGAYRVFKRCVRCERSIWYKDPFKGFQYEDDLYENRPKKKAKYQFDSISDGNEDSSPDEYDYDENYEDSSQNDSSQFDEED